MALLTYARDAETGDLLFGIVADEEGADYVFPEDGEWFESERRIEMLVNVQGEPTTQDGWLTLATTNLGPNVLVDEPTPFDSIEDAVDAAQELVSGIDINEGISPAPEMAASSAAFDQVSQDYPGFLEDEENVDPQAMDNFVMMMLGPIDPEGPNGWILRAVDGEPREGDDEQFVHIPGTPLPGQEDTE